MTLLHFFFLRSVPEISRRLPCLASKTAHLNTSYTTDTICLSSDCLNFELIFFLDHVFIFRFSFPCISRQKLFGRFIVCSGLRIPLHVFRVKGETNSTKNTDFTKR